MYLDAYTALCPASATLAPHAMNALHRLSDDQLERLVQRAIALPDAPPALVRRAIDLWRAPCTRSAPRVAARAAWRRVGARLAFDSWARTQAARGVRAAASDTRHLLFSAEGRDVDLRISPSLELFRVSGQVLGPDACGSVEFAALHEAATDCAHAAPLDGRGEFRLDGVRRGTYRLTLRMGRDEIVLPPVNVGLHAR
jgi:hypothetical protein